MCNDKIYLDNASTTRVSKSVLDAMLPFLTEYYGNPSSRHEMGIIANNAILESRKRIAEIFSCQESEVMFTSGGTESANTAIIGTLLATKKKHIITSEIEHPAVLKTCKMLERFGYSTSYVGVDKYGRVNTDEIKNSINDDTALIAIMHANNETGVIQPIDEISTIANDANVPFFCDATQTAGQVKIDFLTSGIDLLGFSGHKLGAPKGIGVLIHRKSVNMFPIINGGGQELNYRSGTENVAGIVGVSTALSERIDNIRNIKHISFMRNELLKKILTIPYSHFIGKTSMLLPNFICVCFEFVSGNDLVDYLSDNGIYISSSSACSSKSGEPSYVLKAMGVPFEIARGAIRLSMNSDITTEHIERVFSILHNGVTQLRKCNPDYLRRCL